MPRRIAAALLAFALGAPLLWSQEGTAGGSTRWFEWEAPERLLAEVRPLTLTADQELEQVLAWLGLDDAPRGRILWVEGDEELSAALGYDAPGWFAGVTEPSRGRIVMKLRASPDRAALRETFRHELVHWGMLGLGAAAWAQLPAWFHEGVAETWADQRVLAGMGTPLAWRAWRGELAPLARFEREFGRDPVMAAEGYAIAHAFVERLVRLYGDGIIAELMADLAAGQTLDQALISRTGLSVVTHEEALRAELGSFARLMGDLSVEVFLLLALATIVAYPFLLRARRRRHEAFVAKWEAEEAAARSLEEEEEDDRWLRLP